LVYYPAMGGCNRAWCSNGCFASAILQNDAERLLISIEKTTDLFEYTRNNDGYYEDGSFVQHWFFPYTNGYGRGMYSISAKLPYVLSGTEYAYIPQITENQYRFALENMRYAICGENLTAANAGREICREGRTEKTVGAHVETLALIAQYAEGEKKNRIESEIRYFMKLTGKSFVDNVAFPLMQYITEIYNNEDIVPAEPLKCVKVFGSVDRIFKYGERFSAVVANSSNRICRYEAINNENMTGWYMGDGMLYVYTPDYDFDTDFFNKANRYRMPGTTVNGSERMPKSYTGVWSIFNKYPTACGVSSGDFGLSMFELGYPEPDGDHNLFDTDITARKSNFFFDDEIVCVGTGIKDSSGLPVETVLDNRLVRDTDKLYISGKEVTPTPVGKIEDLTPSKVYPTDTKVVSKDIYFDNMGGYLLEEESNIRYRIYDNEKKYLEMTLPHGENVSDGEYAYTLVPNVSREYFDAYKTAHPVSIECMSNTAHVAKKVAAGAIGYAFYEGDTACGITSSGIAAVMITVEDGELCINLSDPSHTQKNIRLSICLDTVKKLLGINEISAISYVSERTEATLENGVLTIEADVFEEASERHTVKLK
ncbi:MAG: hypothetical protein IIX96_04395, partial [Clostridia bacterium]|nr:hypothetical protein [Clostridia bacterium]